jgi:hypothetical protein
VRALCRISRSPMAHFSSNGSRPRSPVAVRRARGSGPGHFAARAQTAAWGHCARGFASHRLDLRCLLPVRGGQSHDGAAPVTPVPARLAEQAGLSAPAPPPSTPTRSADTAPATTPGPRREGQPSQLPPPPAVRRIWTGDRGGSSGCPCDSAGGSASFSHAVRELRCCSSAGAQIRCAERRLAHHDCRAPADPHPRPGSQQTFVAGPATPAG